MMNIRYIGILILLFSGCDKQDDLYSVGNTNGPQINDIISFQKLSTLTLDADSFSVCEITAKINPEAASDKRIVTFITRGGLFSNNDTIMIAKANELGIASASLISGKPGKCIIKAITDIYTIDTSINVQWAYPDDMLLTSDKYILDASETLSLTTQLSRNPGRGRVSDPVKILYTITPLDTSLNLIYPDFSISSSSESTISIINPLEVTGRFKIESKTLSATGDTLRKSIFVTIK